jgi:hypothetical protein
MQCPVCRADNEPVDTCRRCKADLSLVLRVEQQRAAALDAARRRLAAGDHTAALGAAALAQRCRRGGDAARLLALACLLARDFPAALHWHAHGQARTTEGGAA